MTKLVIVIKGGTLQAVYSNEPILYALVDYDNIQADLDSIGEINAMEADLICEDKTGGLAALFENQNDDISKRIAQELRDCGFDNEDHMINQLSKKFSTILNKWLKPEQIKEINRRNKTLDYNGCCASHDFCDPNEAMLQAFKKITGREIDFQSDYDQSVVNKAWNMSSRNNFKM